MNSFYDNFKKVQRQIIRTAKDLKYDDEVMEKLKAAKSNTELSNIMKTARKHMDETEGE